jgi:predicted phosphodiesterase
MNVAILSDIHGNAIALEAVLDDLARTPHDRIVCLGDELQGGPHPAEVAARLRTLGVTVVLGNSDAFLLDGWGASGPPKLDAALLASLEQVRTWSRSRLDASDIEWMRGFVRSAEIPLDEGRTLIAYHGTPRSYDEIITPDTPEADVRAMLDPREDRVYAGGHTHVQFVRHLGATFHMNPGSVGLAFRPGQTPGDEFRADPWAEYARLSVDGARLAVEFRRVPFDVDRLIEAYRSGGRPDPDRGVRPYIR